MKNLFLLVFSLLSFTVIGRDPVRPSDFVKPEEKAFALARLWEMANNDFVFMEQVDRQMWDSTFKAMIPAIMQTPNDYEYYMMLKRFCALLNDGHTAINPHDLNYVPENNPDSIAVIPETWGWFDEGFCELTDVAGMVVVSKVDRKLGGRQPLGSTVTAVDGMPVEDFIREHTLPYICQSTDYMRRIWSVNAIVKGLDGTPLKLDYTKPDGVKGSVSLTRSVEGKDLPAEDFASFDTANAPWQWTRYREYPGGIAYVQLNSFNRDNVVKEFIEYLPQLRSARGIVIDLRNNTGGNTGHGVAILKYLTPDDELRGNISRTRKSISAYKAWGQYQSEADTVGNEWATNTYLAARNRLYEDIGGMSRRNDVPAEDRIIVPTVVLTGYNTASAAEDFLVHADTQPHFTRIGTRTFGSTGQPLSTVLPGGLFTRVCTKDDRFPDGRAFIGVGIIPDIEIVPTVEEYLKGEDLTLKKALEYLESKM